MTKKQQRKALFLFAIKLALTEPFSLRAWFRSSLRRRLEEVDFDFRSRRISQAWVMYDKEEEAKWLEEKRNACKSDDYEGLAEEWLEIELSRPF